MSFLLGLTGGIATGKSTVSEMLRDRGVLVVDADQIAREVVEPGRSAYRKIVAAFGSDILSTDPSSSSPSVLAPIDRAKLGAIIFADPGKRRVLNGITHPDIVATIVRRILFGVCTLNRIIVLDAPLLVETGLYKLMSRNAVVYCPPETQLNRLMKRNASLSVEEARQRIDAQMPIEQKLKLARAVIIDNSSTVAKTEKQVDKLLRECRINWFSMIYRRLGLVVALVLFGIGSFRVLQLVFE